MLTRIKKKKKNPIKRLGALQLNWLDYYRVKSPESCIGPWALSEDVGWSDEE